MTATNGTDTIEYIYDGDGVRVQKISNGVITRYLTDSNNPTGYSQTVEELNGAYAVQKRYTYGHDLISQADLSSGNTYYYGYDGTGSTRMLFESSGNIAAEYDYDAFGTLIYSSGTTSNNYLFHGEYYDADLDLYYLRARWMSTDIGRFWSMDSFEGTHEQPMSLHKYVAFNDNPVNMVDPSGNYTYVDTVSSVAAQNILSFQTVLKIAETGIIATLLHRTTKAKMRAYHYTDDKGYKGINSSGHMGFLRGFLGLKIPSRNYFSPTPYTSSTMAQDRLAMIISPTWRLGIDIYPIGDFMIPPFPLPVLSNPYGSGGGLEFFTYKIMPLAGRNPQWLPLTP